jgi:hypothetical protein
MEKNITNFFGDLELDSGNQHIFQPPPPELPKKKKTKPIKEDSGKPTAVAPRGYSDSIKRYFALHNIVFLSS